MIETENKVIHGLFNKFLVGFTCNRFNRKEIYWISKDEKYVIFKHICHSEYIDRFTENVYCETWYGLYEVKETKGYSLYKGDALKVFYGRFNQFKRQEVFNLTGQSM